MFNEPGYFTVLLIFLLILFAIWRVEPRIFLYLFEKLTYEVDTKRSFVNNIGGIFPSHSLVLDNIDVIKQEYLAFVENAYAAPKAHEVDSYNSSISNPTGPSWRTFYLKIYNGWFQQNCASFPKTTKLFRTIPEVSCVMFSIMEPNNRIPPHEGKLKGILRYQLPLVVPKDGRCEITVNGETRIYQEKVPLMFDDNLTHSVVNESEEYRVILFLDIRKPNFHWVGVLDAFFMKLIQLSPRFKSANVNAMQSISSIRIT